MKGKERPEGLSFRALVPFRFQRTRTRSQAGQYQPPSSSGAEMASRLPKNIFRKCFPSDSPGTLG